MDTKDKPPFTPGSLDPDAFARNLARLMDESGKALAAYLKPRESGTQRDEMAEEIAPVPAAPPANGGAAEHSDR